jgi:hypothetical protein
MNKQQKEMKEAAEKLIAYFKATDSVTFENGISSYYLWEGARFEKLQILIDTRKRHGLRTKAFQALFAAGLKRWRRSCYYIPGTSSEEGFKAEQTKLAERNARQVHALKKVAERNARVEALGYNLNAGGRTVAIPLVMFEEMLDEIERLRKR